MKNETALLNRITNMGFLCAILVILIHCEVPMVAQGFAWEIVRFFQGGITGIAVPFFFLVSGYFLGRHQVECGEYRTEVQKRLWTLVLPFYSTLGMSCIGLSSFL